MLINDDNANNCWRFIIYEQDEFHAQLNLAWKDVNLGAWGPDLQKFGDIKLWIIS